ncbi:glycerol-3-phosphate acyltransferase [Planktothricoides raciborskii]|uniref:Glycerol-3-phosphate acyltransferase n=1 Tax=Planktothricoides raciborskii GIHE-MW2 TaxID=2792601 RepID=A0AAU8JAS7_9CYAN
MTLTQVWGAFLIFTVCPILGGLPLIAWITWALTRRKLAELGTGNIGVSAAFYHGGKLAGILAVISEALKGIAAVLLARQFFPQNPEWELVALIALVMGRYWLGKGAGTTNVVWGFVVHDWRIAGLIFLIGGVSFTILRERQWGRTGVLILMPTITALLYWQQWERTWLAAILSLLLFWIYAQMPDDLDLPPEETHRESEKMFRFFQGDRACKTLNQPLDPRKVGQKAATLSQLKRWGYPVPPGWVLLPGDDPEALIASLNPSPKSPFIVRSSGINEDLDTASAAGQYASIPNICDRLALQQAITDCLNSYDRPGAVKYRQDRNIGDAAIAVLIQPQIRGVFSGVAFSRDPIQRQGDAVMIEALPGDCSQVVSGKKTPERYQVLVSAAKATDPTDPIDSTSYPPENIRNSSWKLPPDLNLPIQGKGDIPAIVIEQIAFLARHIENRYHGIPQDIEWTYDGQKFWILQSRPITTLLPIWTRKIAAEVIPGIIHPLTWSINRPLTCGVWGELFTLVLQDQAQGLNFQETATLHYSQAYFNASLLGEIFRRMGLPPESLEFLTRGSKFSQPPLTATLKNIPGLLRLIGREIQLADDFYRAYKNRFGHALTKLAKQRDQSWDFTAIKLTPKSLIERIDAILELLSDCTYYSILAPLSFAFRRTLLRVEDSELDYSQTPEVAAVRSLQELANNTRMLLPNLNQLLPDYQNQGGDSSQLFATLAEIPEGQTVFDQFEQFLNRYGYLSETATDITVPRWKENPRFLRNLFAQLLFHPSPVPVKTYSSNVPTHIVQKRLQLKGKVTEVYHKLLAELRWSILALEKLWLNAELFFESGDIFFLELSEIRQLLPLDLSSIATNTELIEEVLDPLYDLIEARRDQRQQDAEIPSVPLIVYGNSPPTSPKSYLVTSEAQIQGIGASPGVIQGRIKILKTLQLSATIDRETILVVPYTDAGWAPLLARAGGIIAEVGGQLSHGAIVAREYGIPAVMDIHDAMQIFRDGDLVRIDGGQGIVELL